MKLFDFLKSPDIHQGAAEQANTPGSLLLDVRTPEEFEQGHLPGSQNVPLDDLDKIAQVTDNRNTPLYVYCYSGARSRQAAAMLQRMGYTRVRNIGGIAAWNGRMAK